MSKFLLIEFLTNILRALVNIFHIYIYIYIYYLAKKNLYFLDTLFLLKFHSGGSYVHA